MVWDKEEIDGLNHAIYTAKMIGANRFINLKNILKDHEKEVVFPYVLHTSGLRIVNTITNLRDQGISYRMNPSELNNYDHYRNNIDDFINDNMGGDKLYKYQKSLLYHFVSNDFISYEMSKQLGSTTIFSYLLFHEVLYNKNKNYLCMTANSLDAHGDMELFIENYINIPFYLKVGISKISKDRIYFENGNIIEFKSYKYIPKKNYQLVICDKLTKENDILFSELINRYKTKIDNRLILSFRMYECPKYLTCYAFNYTCNPELKTRVDMITEWGDSDLFFKNKKKDYGTADYIR